MTNMTRFIALTFLTLVTFFLGLAPIKADEPSKEFYLQNQGRWETKGTLYLNEGYRICMVRTNEGDSKQFGIQIGLKNDMTVGLQTLGFTNTRWKLKQSPDEGGHDLEGTLVIKEPDGRTSGIQVEYFTASPTVALIAIRDMQMIVNAIRDTKSLSFAPEDGRMAVTVELDGLLDTLETSMVECLAAATQLEYFKK